MKFLEKLDDIFLNHLMGNRSDKETYTAIAAVLKYKWNKNFTVEVVDNTKREVEPFFGMRVFPTDELHITNITGPLNDADNHSRASKVEINFKNIYGRWRDIQDWTLELDSRIFDRFHLSFNQQELTAMLLHEIGHVIYSAKTIEVFYHAFLECKIRRSVATRASAKVLYTMYTVPLYLACGIRKWSLDSEDLHEEIFADTTVVKIGYGNHLISAYEKIMNACGNSTNNMNPHDIVKTSILWCDKNVTDLMNRTTHMKDELYATGMKTSSNAIKRMIQGLLKKIGVITKERYTGSIAEESGISLESFSDPSFYETTEMIYDIKELGKLQSIAQSMQKTMETRIATEAFGRKKPEIPSQLDVDTLFVEVDRIENHADRRYVLDLIYNQEEKIERFKEFFEHNNFLKQKYADKMESMLRELSSMRKAVLNKRSFDKRYKVFVKYPAGYEG